MNLRTGKLPPSQTKERPYTPEQQAALDAELTGYTPEQLAGRESLRDDERQVAQKESER